MSVTELERARAQERLIDGLETLGRNLQHAFPIGECRSFIGLMHAIDPDRQVAQQGPKALSWHSG
jgi:hypothetical protein